MASISFGNLSIEKVYFGNLPIDKIYYGNIEVYSASSPQQLDSPEIDLTADILGIEKVDGVEYYDIYVDGVLVQSIQAM